MIACSVSAIQRSRWMHSQPRPGITWPPAWRKPTKPSEPCSVGFVGPPKAVTSLERALSCDCRARTRRRKAAVIKFINADVIAARFQGRLEHQLRRGRKPKQESRSVEFRQRLIVWKLTPESLRPTLRKLARELNTSHQLLAHYLDDLEVWQAKENYRKSKDSIKAIRTRAEIEKRPLTPWEEQQMRANDRASFGFLLDSVVLGAFRKLQGELRQDVRAGRPPAAHTGKLLRIFTTSWNQQAQASLGSISMKPRKTENNLPLMPALTLCPLDYVKH